MKAATASAVAVLFVGGREKEQATTKEKQIPCGNDKARRAKAEANANANANAAISPLRLRKMREDSGREDKGEWLFLL